MFVYSNIYANVLHIMFWLSLKNFLDFISSGASDTAIPSRCVKSLSHCPIYLKGSFLQTDSN